MAPPLRGSTDRTPRAPTSITATGTTAGSSSAADAPGFGIAASVLGGGLALARLLQKRS